VIFAGILANRFIPSGAPSDDEHGAPEGNGQAPTTPVRRTRQLAR